MESPPRLEVDIYQIVDDSMLMKNRSDGTGWDWCWADLERDWMNATPARYAYRCLPLTIANQTGWWIKNPVGFTATWNGRTTPGTIEFQFDTAGELWSPWINSQFGEGVITWNTPFLFRTRPAGSRLLICGAPNYFKTNAHPLTAIIESDWISMSFTMNWKLMIPGLPVRFEVGEPLFQAIPLVSNICQDLEDASVSYQRLSDNPELHADYMDWNQGRKKFHEQKAAGEVKGTEWQKDYFQGRDGSGRETATTHKTKIKQPVIRMAGSLAGKSPAIGTAKPVAIPSQSPIREGISMSNQTSNGSPAYAPASEKQAATQVKQASAQQAAGACPMSQQFVSTSMSGVYLMDASPRLSQGEPPTQLAAEGPLPNQAAIPPQTEVESSLESQIDDGWRCWLAENLFLGHSPDQIVESMLASGISLQVAELEINRALQSPYLRGSERLISRLMKRDWMLATYRKLNRLNPKSTEIERRPKLSRAEFLDQYYCPNRPVIITEMMEDWPALKKWNLDYFAQKFGNRDVDVQMGRDSSPNYETESTKFVKKIRFGDFIEKLRSAGETNDFYLTANNNSTNKQVLPELWDDIVQIREYLTQDRNGGFFWMGPAGTITPFHHDLTNNFMAQVIGRKLIKLVPSWDTPLMDNHLHVFSQIDGRAVPPSPRPSIDEPQILECVLNPGEILFLPIGCWHYVQGLDISVTVSFTNFVFDNDFSSFYKTFGPV